MLPDETDTIAAIATALQPAGRGVLRLSGPDTLAVVGSVIESIPHLASLSSGSRRLDAKLRLSIEGRQREIAADLYVWPNQQSYTGQPSVELHLPGSPPVLEAALATLCEHGARLATAGEFTLRAFMAGRLDLTEAEAVLGVIDARSDSDLQTALHQLAGGLSAPLTRLRDEMLQLLAELEAGLDFVEEEDVRFIEVDELTLRLSQAASHVQAIAEQMHTREQVVSLSQVVLVGPANAGKSSLYNALAGNSAAIVSSQAGTTRDTLRRIVKHSGHEFELVDTAGVLDEALQHPKDDASIDSLADDLRDQAIHQAALVLHCQPGDAPLDEWRADAIRVITKVDLPLSSTASSTVAAGEIGTSVKTGAGLKELLATITQTLANTEGEVLASTAARCRDSLREAAGSLSTASILAPQWDDELVASEIRAALNSLGEVVGAVATDDILDRIFGQFCIGK